ncbi:MAG: hypothetical protein E6Q94_08865 [Burkholderiaceae bacterium]|nr:MAG: hypothetical protein E6Q94_08865 [Burkholderiaceae bacterium]
MATKRFPSSEQSTVKVRIIDFEMSGSDQSLQESLQTIAAAFSGGGQRVQVSRPAPRAQLAVKPAAEAELESEGEQGAEADDSVQDVQPRAVAASTRKPTKPPVVKVLDGINFTDTDPTLKDFYESKNPTSDLAKYLVVAYWYKNMRGLPDLTPDHFHTAFRALKVATARNALQPIRDLRSSRNGKFAAGAERGTCTIHHIGETFVEEMGKGG